MPAKMRSFYLRHMYMKNMLAMPGGIEPDSVPIELPRVKLPAYFVSTVEDRIAPWKTTYKGAKHENTRARRSKSTIAPRR
jgi:polyhydroxyalkanoate synthase subunit PhaC